MDLTVFQLKKKMHCIKREIAQLQTLYEETQMNVINKEVLDVLQRKQLFEEEM